MSRKCSGDNDDNNNSKDNDVNIDERIHKLHLNECNVSVDDINSANVNGSSSKESLSSSSTSMAATATTYSNPMQAAVRAHAAAQVAAHAAAAAAMVATNYVIGSPSPFLYPNAPSMVPTVYTSYNSEEHTVSQAPSSAQMSMDPYMIAAMNNGVNNSSMPIVPMLPVNSRGDLVLKSPHVSPQSPQRQLLQQQQQQQHVSESYAKMAKQAVSVSQQQLYSAVPTHHDAPDANATTTTTSTVSAKSTDTVIPEKEIDESAEGSDEDRSSVGRSDSETTNGKWGIHQPRGKFKSKQCVFFQRGECRKADTCTFAHGVVDMEIARMAKAVAKMRPSANSPAVLSHKTKMCEFFLRGECRKDQHCSYAHSKNEQVKTKMCDFFFRGECKKGSMCTFAHAEVELIANPSPPMAASAADSSSITILSVKESNNDNTMVPDVSQTIEAEKRSSKIVSDERDFADLSSAFDQLISDNGEGDDKYNSIHHQQCATTQANRVNNNNRPDASTKTISEPYVEPDWSMPIPLPAQTQSNGAMDAFAPFGSFRLAQYTGVTRDAGNGNEESSRSFNPWNNTDQSDYTTPNTVSDTYVVDYFSSNNRSGVDATRDLTQWNYVNTPMQMNAVTVANQDQNGPILYMPRTNTQGYPVYCGYVPDKAAAVAAAAAQAAQAAAVAAQAAAAAAADADASVEAAITSTAAIV